MKTRIFTVLLAIATVTNYAWGAGYPLKVEPIKEDDGSWSLVATNIGSSAVFLRLAITDAKNAYTGSQNKSVEKALEPGAREIVLAIAPDEPTKELKFKWKLAWTYGRGRKVTPDDSVMRLPFPEDLTFDVINAESTTKKKPHEQYAVDIMMPENTPVINMRTGVLMEAGCGTPSDKYINGASPLYEINPNGKGCYAKVLHQDGTWAEYHHLKLDSISQSIGSVVTAGTQIATSGDTGDAKGKPHLRVALLAPQDGLDEPSSNIFRVDLPGRNPVRVVTGITIGATYVASNQPKERVNQDPLTLGAGVEMKNGSRHVGVFKNQSWLRFERIANIVEWIFSIIAIGLLIAYAKKTGIIKLPKIAIRNRSDIVKKGAQSDIEKSENEGEAIGIRSQLISPMDEYVISRSKDILGQKYGIGIKVSAEAILPNYQFTDGEKTFFDYAIYKMQTGDIVGLVDVVESNEELTSKMYTRTHLAKKKIYYIAAIDSKVEFEIKDLIKSIDSD